MGHKYAHKMTGWIALAAISLAPAAALGAPILKHKGANDPLTEGWSQDNPTTKVTLDINDVGEPIFDDGGVDAWRIDTTVQTNGEIGTQIRYAAAPEVAGEDGWKASVIVNVTQIPDSSSDLDTVVEVYDYFNTVNGIDPLDHAYMMRFGSTADGRTRVSLEGSFKSHTAPTTGYHLFEMIFLRDADRDLDAAGVNPVNNAEGDGAVALYIDGVKVEDNYKGVHEDNGHPRPNFDFVQFGSYFADTGSANYAYVGFENGAALQPGIPEPASVALLAVGGAMLLSRRRS